MMRKDYARVGLLVLAVATAAAACGGGGDDRMGMDSNNLAAAPQSMAVSGAVVSEAAAGGSAVPNTFRVRATASSGAMHETETDPANGRFKLMLPPDESYVMGFEHREMANGQMHFAGHMVFNCGAGESDHFFVSGRQQAVDLGTITVRLDGSFARPERNPLDQLDRDGNGTPDSRDPNTQCVEMADENHDGFYDDDMNHDGFHDDDMDHDGRHDCAMDDMAAMSGMEKMGHENESCSGPGMTGTPEQTATPEAPGQTPPTAPTPTPDEHGH